MKRTIQNTKPILGSIVLLGVAMASGHMPITFQINNLTYYLFFFYMGYVINKMYYKISEWCKQPIVLIISGLVVLILSRYNGNLIVKIFTAIAGIVFMIGIIQYINLKLCDCKLYKNIKKNNFGVYLFHPMIIYLLFYYMGNLDMNPILLCSVIIIVTCLLSYFATSLVRKLKLGIIIGE